MRFAGVTHSSSEIEYSLRSSFIKKVQQDKLQDIENEKDPMRHEDVIYLQFGGAKRKACYTPWYGNNEYYNNDFPLGNEGIHIM
jgi:hypothetical protein